MVSFFKLLPTKRNLAATPAGVAAGADAENVVAIAGQDAASPLLKGVLAEPEQGTGSTGRRVPVVPLSQKLSIGTKLGEAKRLVADETAKLFALLDTETAEGLARDIRGLEELVCRIAFVGQMNAGKSTLINVLVEQAELLPADINPWTTVVTNLHFGVPGKPVSGASFKLFTLDEWQRLSVGGRVRELTERLFPDFDWALLNEQIEAMRQRALSKLGPRFLDMLGSEHNYPALTPGLLNRYVGAGAAGSAPVAPSGEGEYSDITKLANVYFDLGAFNFPTVLIDTPGVNDPFLVRDEITRQGLEHADVCVIVVTARQPLSNADLNLMRMLRGLDKNRMIIFVNKVDEIDADPVILEQVRQRVQTILEREFPSAKIPIVLGSALWGRSALFGEPLATKTFEAATTIDSEAAFWNTGATASGAIADDLLENSGLPSLALSISDLMREGTISESLDEAICLLKAAGINSKACTGIELDLLKHAEGDLAKGAAHLNDLIELCQQIHAVFDEAEERLKKASAAESSALYDKLSSIVTGYTEEFLRDLEGDFAKLAQTDLRLRVKLEIAFAAAFAEAAKAVSGEEAAMKEAIHALLESHRLNVRFELPEGSHAIAPSLAALGEPVGIGLSNGQTASLSGEELRAYTAKMIAADFAPIVSRLVEEARASLAALSSSILQRSRILTLSQLEHSARTLSGLLSDMATRKEPAALIQEQMRLRQEHAARIDEIIAALDPASPR